MCGCAVCVVCIFSVLHVPAGRPQPLDPLNRRHVSPPVPHHSCEDGEGQGWLYLHESTGSMPRRWAQRLAPHTIATALSLAPSMPSLGAVGDGGGASGGVSGVSGGVDVESGSEWETVAVACQRIDTPNELGETGGGDLEDLEDTVGPDTSLEHPHALIVWLEIRRSVKH